MQTTPPPPAQNQFPRSVWLLHSQQGLLSQAQWGDMLISWRKNALKLLCQCLSQQGHCGDHLEEKGVKAGTAEGQQPEDSPGGPRRKGRRKLAPILLACKSHVLRILFLSVPVKLHRKWCHFWTCCWRWPSRCKKLFGQPRGSTPWEPHTSPASSRLRDLRHYRQMEGSACVLLRCFLLHVDLSSKKNPETQNE